MPKLRPEADFLADIQDLPLPDREAAIDEYRAVRKELELQGVPVERRPQEEKAVGPDLGYRAAQANLALARGATSAAEALQPIAEPVRAVQREVFEKPADLARMLTAGGLEPHIGTTPANIAGELVGGAWEYAPALPLLAAPTGTLGLLARIARSAGGFGAYEQGTEALKQAAGETPPSTGAQLAAGAEGAVSGAVGHAAFAEALPALLRAVGRPLMGGVRRGLQALRPTPPEAPAPLRGVGVPEYGTPPSLDRFRMLPPGPGELGTPPVDVQPPAALPERLRLAMGLGMPEVPADRALTVPVRPPRVEPSGPTIYGEPPPRLALPAPTEAAPPGTPGSPIPESLAAALRQPLEPDYGVPPSLERFRVPPPGPGETVRPEYVVPEYEAPPPLDRFRLPPLAPGEPGVPLTEGFVPPEVLPSLPSEVADAIAEILARRQGLPRRSFGEPLLPPEVLPFPEKVPPLRKPPGGGGGGAAPSGKKSRPSEPPPLTAQGEAAAAAPDITEKPVAQLAAQPAAGMVRLYRGEGVKGGSVPSWIQEARKESGAEAAGGRWFTDDPEIAQWYVEDAGPGGRLVAVDVPREVADRFRVSGLSRDIARFSRDPEREFFLPQDVAVLRSGVEPSATRVSRKPGRPEEPVERPSDKLTFEQYFQSEQGYWDPVRAKQDPQFEAIRRRYTGEYAPIPTSKAQELRQAIAEAEFVAKSGTNRAGKALPPDIVESARRQAAEYRERLKELPKDEAKEPSATARPFGDEPDRPVTDIRDLGPRAPRASTQGSYEGSARAALDVEGVTYEYGTLHPEGARNRIKAGWARRGEGERTVYRDPLTERWVSRDVFTATRRPVTEQSFDRAAVEAFQARTGELPSPTSVKRFGAKTPEKAPAAPGQQGAAVKVGWSGGSAADRVPARYEVVNLKDLVTSHDVAGRENPAYPQAFQQRLRGRAASRNQIDDIVKNFDPERLGENVLGSDGAPVIGDQGLVVESGNGRVNALRQVPPEQMAVYQDWLLGNAERFGIDAKALRNMQEAGQAPILVRRRTEPMSWPRLSEVLDAWNQSAVSELSPTERALRDATKLTPDLILKLGEVHGDRPLAREDASPFLAAFNKEVVPATEKNSFLNAKGQVSTQGIERAERSLFVYAWGGKAPAARLPIIDRAISSAGEEGKAILNALERVTPAYAKFKAKAQAGEAFTELDISDDVVRALGVVENLRRTKSSVDEWMKTEDVLEPISAELRVMVELFHQNRRSSMAMAEILDEYIRVAAKQVDPAQGGLWGKVEPPSRADMLRMAHKMRNLEMAPEEALADVAREKALNAAAQQLEDRAALARAAGDFEQAKTMELQAQIYRMGKKPGRGGVDLSREEIEAQAKALFKKVGVDETAVKEFFKDYGTAFMMKVTTPDFALRKEPGFLGMVGLIRQAAIKGGRLRRLFLEQAPGRPHEKGGFPGKTWEQMTRRERRTLVRARRPGFEWVWRHTPHDQKAKLVKAAAALDAEGAENVLDARLRDEFGLNETGIQRFRQYHNLMQDALHRVINPVRVAQGLERLEGRASYMPHTWLGQWELRAADGRPLVTDGGSTFKTLHQAFAGAAKLAKAQPDLKFKIVPSYRNLQMLHEAPGTAEAKALDRLLHLAEKSDEVLSDDLREALRKNVTVRGMPAFFEKRRGAQGYETKDFEKVVHQYLSLMSRWAPMRKARAQIERIMMGEGLADELAKVSPDLAEMLRGLPQVRVNRYTNPKTYAAFDQYMNDVFGVQRPTERAFDDILKAIPGLRRFLPERPVRSTVRSARALEAHLKLGLGNLSFGIVNLAQFVSHATPVLGPRWALVGARRALQAKLFPDSPAARALRRYQRLGAIQPFFLEAEAETSLRKGLEKASFIAGQLSEQANRAAFLLGADARLRARGARGDRLVRMATEFVQDKIDPLDRAVREAIATRMSEQINFAYDIASRPSMFRGPWGEMAGQFRMFGLSTMQLWARLGQLAAKGDPLPLIAHFGVLYGLHGLLGSPLSRSIDSVARWASPDSKSPMDRLLEADLPQWALRGTPALLGIDASRRLGYGDLLPEDMADWLGPVAGTISDSIGLLMKGDYDTLLRETAPGPGAWGTRVHEWIAQEPGKGVPERNERDRTKFFPTAWEQRIRAFGFRPLLEAELADEDRLKDRKVQQYKRQRAHFIDRAVEVVETLQGADRTEALKRLAVEARENKTPFTHKDVVTEWQKKRTPQILRSVQQVPKALRPEYLQRTAPLREEQRRRQLEALGRILKR